MTIGIDARLWNETGVGRYIRNLVSEVTKHSSHNYIIFSLPTNVSAISSVVPTDNVSIVVTNARWHGVAEQTQFLKELQSVHMDLVHFTYFSHPIFYNRPFVITIHDLIMDHFVTGHATTHALPLYHAKRVVYKQVIKHAIDASKKIIVPLESVKEDFLSRYRVSAGKIKVVHEGYLLQTNSSPDASESIKKLKDTPFFLYVGNMYPHKNIEFLIRSFLHFKNNNVTHALVLVSKNDVFTQKIKDKYNDPSLIFFHDITDDDLKFLYEHTVSYVSASLMEGFGLPVLEAMGYGSRLVLSDIAAHREVAQKLPLYFDPRKTESVIEAFNKVILDTDNKKVYKEQSVRAAHEFSWNKMARQTIEIYEGSIGVRSR